MESKKHVGIVGMPGAGKSTLSACGKRMGFDVIVMGDIVREETAKRGLKPTPQNIGRTMLNLRREEDSEVIAKKCIQQILKIKNHLIMIEGIRSLDEVEAFKRIFPLFTIIAIHASPNTRFLRLFKRSRSDDPKNRKVFKTRDNRELEIGIGSVIAIADYMIVNEGSLQEFEFQIEIVLKNFLNKDKNVF